MYIKIKTFFPTISLLIIISFKLYVKLTPGARFHSNPKVHSSALHDFKQPIHYRQD